MFAVHYKVVSVRYMSTNWKLVVMTVGYFPRVVPVWYECIFQVLWFKGVAAGKLPLIKCADIIIYTISTYSAS